MTIPTTRQRTDRALQENQSLIAQVQELCRDSGLPSGEVRPLMKRVGDVDAYAHDEAQRALYLDVVKDEISKYLEAHPRKAQIYFVDDPDLLGVAVARWQAMADKAGYPADPLRRSFLWEKALGTTLPKFRGSEDDAESLVDAALLFWQHEQLKNPPQATESAKPAETPAAQPPAAPANPPASTGAPDVPPSEPDLTDDEPPSDTGPGPDLESLGKQIASDLKLAFPDETRDQYIARMKAALGSTSTRAMYTKFGSVQKVLDTLARYIKRETAARDSGIQDEQPAASAGWDGQLSGDLLITAKALAAQLRGPAIEVSMAPERLADIAWRSGLYSNITTWERAMMIVWESLELGIPPTMGLSHIRVTRSKEGIIGKVMSVHLMLGLVIASGLLESFSIYPGGTMNIKRRGLPEYIERFDVGNDVDKNIRAAIRRALRRIFPDVLTLGIRTISSSASNIEISNQ